MPLKNGFDIDVMLTQTDSSGRLLLFKALIKEENYTFANIRRPKKTRKLFSFIINFQIYQEPMISEMKKTIMGGDFNCPLNVNLDKKGGIQVP